MAPHQATITVPVSSILKVGNAHSLVGITFDITGTERQRGYPKCRRRFGRPVDGAVRRVTVTFLEPPALT